MFPLTFYSSGTDNSHVRSGLFLSVVRENIPILFLAWQGASHSKSCSSYTIVLRMTGSLSGDDVLAQFFPGHGSSTRAEKQEVGLFMMFCLWFVPSYGRHWMWVLEGQGPCRRKASDTDLPSAP